MNALERTQAFLQLDWKPALSLMVRRTCDETQLTRRLANFNTSWSQVRARLQAQEPVTPWQYAEMTLEERVAHLEAENEALRQ